MNDSSSRIIQKILNSSQLRDESSILENFSALNRDQNGISHSLDNTVQSSPETVEMVIELDSSKSVVLEIHYNDDPLILAKKFCFEHSIDPRVIKTLTNNIRNVQNLQFGSAILNSHSQKPPLSKGTSDCTKGHGKNPSQENKENDSSTINVPSEHLESYQQPNIRRMNPNPVSGEKSENRPKELRESVFERLYKDSRRKNLPSSASKNNTLNQTSEGELYFLNEKPQKNICKKLNESAVEQQLKKLRPNDSMMSAKNSSSACLVIYDKNTKARQTSIKKRQTLHRQMTEKQLEACTFKPQINSVSEIIAKKLPNHHQKSRHRDVKRAQAYLSSKEQKQLEECTFKPQTLQSLKLKKSSDLSRQMFNNRYDFLYQDSKIRESRRRQSFRKSSQDRPVPKINKLSKSIIGGQTFFQRLENDFKKRSESKEKVLKNQLKEDRQRNPSTGRGPASTKRSKVSIGEHLYNEAKMKEQRLSRQRKNFCDRQVSKEKFTCKQSSSLYQRTKYKAFCHLFEIMDSDQDGVLSHTKIAIGDLSEDVLRLLTPLLVQMEEMKAQLSKSEFFEAIERLFKTFCIVDRQLILSLAKKDCHSQACEEEIENTFKPFLNENSLEWAGQYCRTDGSNLYDIWKSTQAEKQEKLEQIRTMKALEELEECSFHPRLFR